MKSKNFKVVTFYSALTCVLLIALLIVVLLMNFEIPLETSERVQNVYMTKSVMNNDENFKDSNDSWQSERIPINQTRALNANLKDIGEQVKPNSSDILLYRKRRYLLFPEGSSFQIVYDLIIPVVDYTNYAIMGITVAVAWELPSKPPSEIENDIIEKLNDGTLGISRNDSIDGIKYIDTPPKQKNFNDTLSKIIYIQPTEYSSPSKTIYYDPPQKYTKHRTEYGDNKKYIPRPVYTGPQEKKPVYYTSSYNSPFKLKSINNERIDEGPPSSILWKSNNAKRPTGKDLKSLGSVQSQRIPRPKQHAVYHIMGKRSTEKHSSAEQTHPLLEKLDRIHLQYHRSSRHALYSKIEVMFNKQGKNGTECVLRALCETGQRRRETKPAGLLVELLRTIFTLPEADTEMRNRERHPKRFAWDEARASNRICSEVYPLCEDFIWNSKYIY